MRLIDADAIYPWYMDAFDFDPNEVRFSMNDIRDNLDNIPTHPTPSNTLGALECVEKKNGKVFPVEPISYLDCSNAMLKMWMDNVVTDGEYNRIMDKLNKKHEEDMRGENE